jgi:hypothetical protein
MGILSRWLLLSRSAARESIKDNQEELMNCMADLSQGTASSSATSRCWNHQLLNALSSLSKTSAFRARP